MSADSISVCPQCYSLEYGEALIDITIDELDDESMPADLFEYHEIFIDRGHVVVKYV